MPGGVLAFTVKEGDGEGWTEARLDQPRWFVYWREPALRSILQRHGWDVLSINRRENPYVSWLAVICRAPATG